MLGRKSIYAEECFAGNFIGVDFGINEDLTDKLPENWRDFNKAFIPVWLTANPGKSKIAAGLACGSLHTVAKGIKQGDIVICPNGLGSYRVGEVVSEYSYHPGTVLPHRRQVNWFSTIIERLEMSPGLKSSTGSTGTSNQISKHYEEIEKLLAGEPGPDLIATDESVEDPTVFALEKHLEEFLVHNWASTELGKKYVIFEVDGELVGQQYPSDTGPIDILAISKDKKELLVVELKKGRASDVVVGQIQRYMGYVLDELVENGQTVRGVIIALEDDLRMKRALRVATNIDFYRYQVSFQLFKV